jgi:protease-4
MGERFKAEVVAARGKKLNGNVDYATGEAWDGVQAKEIGLVDEVSTLDAVTASLGHPVHDFGPQAVGAGWLNGMTSVFESAARLLEAMR